MIPPLAINWWRFAAYALIAALLVGFGYTQGKKPYYELKAQIKTEAKARADQNKRDAETRNAITQRNESEHAFTIASLRADLDRLRDSPPSFGVPPAPPGSLRIDLACFDRGELDKALRAYRAGVLQIVGEGSEATAALNTARSWWAEQGDIGGRE